MTPEEESRRVKDLLTTNLYLARVEIRKVIYAHKIATFKKCRFIDVRAEQVVHSKLYDGWVTEFNNQDEPTDLDLLPYSDTRNSTIKYLYYLFGVNDAMPREGLCSRFLSGILRIQATFKRR